jgi:hypothetical protein
MKYYQHKSNSFNDEKIAELYMKFGYEGLGLFYTALEKIADQEKPMKTEVLKSQLNVGKRLNKCWNFMEDIGLISSSNGESFNINQLKDIEIFQEKRGKTTEKVAYSRKKDKFVASYIPKCNSPEEKRREEKRLEEKRREGTASPGGDAPTPTAEVEKDMGLPQQDGYENLRKDMVTEAERIELCLDTWNRIVPHKVRSIDNRRKEVMAERLKEPGFFDSFEEICKKIAASDFLTGRKPSEEYPDWKATFNWVIKDSNNWNKILEGGYDNGTGSSQGESPMARANREATEVMSNE